MRRGKAYLSMVLIALGIVGLDGFIVTSTRSLSRIAKSYLDSKLKGVVEYSDLTCTIGGDLDVTNVGVYLTKEHLKVLSIDRVHVEFAWRNGTIVPRQVELEGPRFFLSDRVLEVLRKEAAEAPAASPSAEPGFKISPHHLPKVLLHGGTIEVAYPEVLHGDAPQVLQIGEIWMVPVQGFQYSVGGSLTGKLMGNWTMTGDLDVSTGTHDISIHTTGANFGGDLRAALSPRAQFIWDRFKPEGKADVDVRFTLPEGGTFAFRANVRPVDMACTYQFFPYRVEHVSGELEFAEDGFAVKHLEGATGRFKVQFDGAGTGYEANAGLSFRIEVEGLALDEKIRLALPEAARRVYDRFAPHGFCDLRGRIRRDIGPDKEVRYPLDVTFRDASCRFDGFPYGVEKLNGEIRIDTPEVTVKSLRGMHGNARMSFNGIVGNIDGDPSIDLAIFARDLPLDIELKQALPERMKKLWDDFQPTGTVNASWRVSKAVGSPEVNTGTVTVRNGRVVYKEIPLPVSEVGGQLRIEAEGIRIDHMVGKMENGNIEVNGTWSEVPNGYNLKLEVDHRGAVINDRYKAAMPKQISNMLTSLNVTANADYNATLTIQDRGGKWTKNACALRALLSQGVMNTAFPVEEVDGEVNVVIDAPEGETLTGSGTLSLRQARFKKKLVRDLHCSNFYIEGLKVTFPLIQGRAYGGNVTGTFWVDGNTTELGGQFTADRVELRDYVQDTDRYARRDMSGKINITVNNLGGFGNNPKSLTGKGSMTIVDGHLQEVPGLVAMLSGDSNFETCRADFTISDRKFKIRKPNVLAFETKDSGVYAYGWMDFDLNYQFRAWSKTASFFGIVLFKPLALVFDALKAPFKIQVDGSLMDPDQVVHQETDPSKMAKDDD